MSLFNKEGGLIFPVVIKYSGLLEGKGVVVAKDFQEFIDGWKYLKRLIIENCNKKKGG